MLNEFEKTLAPERQLLVTVWDPDNDDVEYTFPSYIEEVQGLKIRIAGPPPSIVNKAAPLMQPALVVGAVLEVNPAPFLFYPVIQSAEANNSFWLEVSESSRVEKTQQRNHVRIPMVIPFHVEYQQMGQTLTLSARTENVSGGGLRFTSAKLFPQGQELLLALQLSPDLPLMRLPGTVVFSAENNFYRKPEDMYATACQFHGLDEATQTLIMKECFRRELGLNR